MNNNITEDYYSFEVSKLFKEKGFDIACQFYYHEIEKGHRLEGVLQEHKSAYCNGILIEKQGYRYFNSPTHSLAIKWIRENFGIHIHVHLENRIKGLEITTANKYQASINRTNHTYTFNKVSEGDISDGEFRKPRNTSQEATEAALLYTLKNLIK